jgi:hypothetical protein
VRRVLFWYDHLSDWQRVKYAGVAILFLLACGGYLLGLGSEIVLQRVAAQEALLAAEELPTGEPTPDPTSTAVSVAAVIPTPPTSTPAPTATSVPPTRIPTPTPFSAPQIAEPPALPRQLPAAPIVVAPVAPRATPTVAKPRNVETSKPELPAGSVATPTAGVVRALPVGTAVRAATPGATTRPGSASTPLPTLAVPPTRAPTAASVRLAPTQPAGTPTRAPQNTPAPTPVKTPAAR